MLGSFCPFVTGFGWSVSMVTYPSFPNNTNLQLCLPVSSSFPIFFFSYNVCVRVRYCHLQLQTCCHWLFSARTERIRYTMTRLFPRIHSLWWSYSFWEVGRGPIPPHMCSCGSWGLILSISVSSSPATGFPCPLSSYLLPAFSWRHADFRKWDSERYELTLTRWNLHEWGGKKSPIQAEHAHFPFFLAFGKSLKVSMFSITMEVLSHANTYILILHWSSCFSLESISLKLEWTTDLGCVSANPLAAKQSHKLTHTHAQRYLSTTCTCLVVLTR